MDIEVGPRGEVPNLVNSLPELSVFEDGGGDAGRLLGSHGRVEATWRTCTVIYDKYDSMDPSHSRTRTCGERGKILHSEGSATIVV